MRGIYSGTQLCTAGQTLMRPIAWAAETIVVCKNCHTRMSFTGGDGTEAEQWKEAHYIKCQKTQADLKSILRGSEEGVSVGIFIDTPGGIVESANDIDIQRLIDVLARDISDSVGIPQGLMEDINRLNPRLSR